jgi:RHS repeat-associated protein
MTLLKRIRWNRGSWSHIGRGIKGANVFNGWKCLTVLMALLSTAAEADITGQWSYGGVNYNSEQEAVAAMQGAKPQNSVLTENAGATGMSTGQTQYKWVAPPAAVDTTWVYYAGSGSPFFSDDQDALTWEMQTFWPAQYYGCQIGTAGPGKGWNYVSNLGSPSYGPGYTQSYDFTTWSTSYWTGQCNSFTNVGALGVNKWQTYTCPQYYSYDSGTNECIDTDVDYVYYRPLIPPCNCDRSSKSQSPVRGDPIDTSSGDFSEIETDYQSPVLSFRRYYHSVTGTSGRMGNGWTDRYAAFVVFGSNGSPVGLVRPDGHQDPVVPMSSGSLYKTVSEDGIHLGSYGSGGSAGWMVYLPDGGSEIYSASGTLLQLVNPAGQVTTLNYTNGQLTSVVGPFGHTLQFSYNGSLISQITDPAGNAIVYTYDALGNLASVQYPDSTSRTYQYNTSNELIGITDENGSSLTSATYDSLGRVTSSQNAGGANATSVTYGATTATVTDSLASTTVISFATPASYPPVVNSVSQNGLTRTFNIPDPSVDVQQRPTQMTDERGNITTYSYDESHLTSKTEASGTSQARTTSYQYQATSNSLPTLTTEPLKTTAYTYTNTANVATKTVTDTSVSPNVSRTWSYTYDAYNRLVTVDGPRTDLQDVTTYSYYTCTAGVQCGLVQTSTDGAGHVTTFNSYNAHGQPLTITDPNGVVTTLTYDLRQRLASRQVGNETTTFNYWPTGLLKNLTLPDGSYVQYTYDAAHRLTQVSDGAGNSIAYTLDAAGNRTSENVTDSSNVLHRTHSRVFNSLDQLYQDINAAGTAAVTTTFGYDNYGNQISSSAPLGRNTASAYDALNRLNQITDPASGITQLGYDANDNLTSVLDPRSLTTSYAYSGFGDLTTQSSPDTGSTTNTYDSAANLSTSTDARGASSTYTYDALNRMTSAAYSLGGSVDQAIAFTYDAGTNGIGHLTGASDANHSMSWSYDALGRTIGKSQTVAGVTRSVSYAYTSGDLTTLTTASGQTIIYGYNGNHQITSVSFNGTTLINGVTYEPFGSVSGWTWGNGTNEARVYDQDGNVTNLQAAEGFTYGYDSAFRITGITDTDNAALSQSYGYDALDRLTSASGTSLNESWTYDANGNRLTQGGTTSSTYTVATASNQLASISGGLTRTYAYASSGQITSYGGITFTYMDSGRLSSISNSGSTTTYIFNALGQRVEKSVTSVTLFVYDEAGHLLGEYDGSGNLIEETIWMGDVPVATLQPNGTGVSVYYIHTDHLNTPRRITSPSNNVIVWRWDSEPFGTAAANQNPSGSGTPFVYNLRFPGQYYDVETGLNYNYFRDYDPATGRYVESDPIGLAGGSYSTYAYASGNPVSEIDPLGLAPPGRTGTPTFPTVLPPNVAIPGTPENSSFVQSAWQAWSSGANSNPAAAPNSAAQAASSCPNNNDECNRLNQNVQNAKNVVNALGACRPGMTPDQLRLRYYAWLDLATARAIRDQKCWNGGDDGHQNAQAQAWDNVGSCGNLLVQ